MDARETRIKYNYIALTKLAEGLEDAARVLQEQADATKKRADLALRQSNQAKLIAAQAGVDL